jgi:hypothetical protein
VASSQSSVLSRAASQPKRLGSETPRVFTPPLGKLTPRTSAGFRCIDFAEQVLEIELLPWQKWLLIHALELLADGTFRFRTVVLLVARQNGKSTLMQVLTLWRMYVDGAPLVIGTAQNLDVAEEQWQAVVDMAEDIPDLAAEVEQVLKVNGKKQLRLTTGERYKVAAASRRGGRGLSGDLVLLDELREHQTWEAWAAVTKTTMARSRAQIWAASNAGDSASVVLGFLRKLAHQALGDPDGIAGSGVEAPELGEDAETDGDSLGIFEWSAHPGCDVWDRDGWAQGNPALGHTITEKALASAARTDPEAVFRTECMCQWVDSMTDSVFGAGNWEACGVQHSEIVKDLRLAVAVTHDRAHSCIAAAGFNAAGLMHGEPVEHRRGTGWLVTRAKELQEKHKAVVVLDGRGPAADLIPAFEAASVELLIASTGDVLDGCAQLYDRVQEPATFVHMNYPELDGAVAGAQWRPVGDRRAWGRKTSTFDISPLEAVTLAAWGAGIATDYDPLDNIF